MDCIKDGTMTLNLKNLCLDGTIHAPSKIWSFLIFNKLVRKVGLKVMLQLVDKRKVIALVLMELVTIVKLSSKQWVFFHYCPCQEARPSLTDNEIMRGKKKREQDQMCKEYVQQKGYKIIEMWECNWWELYRTDATVKNQLRANFPYQRPLSEERLMQEIRSGKLFAYGQCELKVPEHVKAYFANFSPNFQKHCCE